MINYCCVFSSMVCSNVAWLSLHYRSFSATGKYENEQHQEDQESQDGGYRVDETLDQVTHGAPVSADTKNINIRVGRDDI